MVKVIAYVVKHKIMTAVILVLIVAGGFGLNLFLNPSPQRLMNQIEFKTTGYENDGTITTVDDSKNNLVMSKLFEAITIAEAKKVGFDTGVVKRIYENNRNKQYSTLANFQNGSTDIYAGTSNSEAMISRMSKLKYRFSSYANKNGDTVTFYIEDTSADPAFKEISRKYTIKGLKKKEHVTVKKSDFKVVFDKKNYDKTIKEDAAEIKKDREGDEFADDFQTPEEEAKSNLTDEEKEELFTLYYKNKKIDNLYELDNDDLAFDSSTISFETDIDTIDEINFNGGFLLSNAVKNYKQNKDKTIYSLNSNTDYSIKVESK